ncbi:hypothetical protein [Hansschlegelia zhihuaiae]|uniref:Uncharacterized protein n=1 Tax=Hansschlegelia zhihuaiae TaxID=405005 RepID=A0A4Q0MK09_9HYPH|nr:hypothetical protein [Hansschlegelia zhihuaiae]RXF74061.1 hypothetical protein EK403_06720 [Hansschlegelia zhihuaiae]
MDLTTEQIRFLKRLSIRADALRRAMEAVMNGTTPDHAKWGAFAAFAKTYNVIANDYFEVTGDPVNRYNTAALGNGMNTLWPVQKEIFDTVFSDVLILSGLLLAYDTGISSSRSEIQDLLSANLRKVIFRPPAVEKDVQDAVEALLIGRGYQKGIDYDREAGKFKFSGKEFIPDFNFILINTVVEVKLIRADGDRSRCIEEMSADIPAYLSHYGAVLFCVYDLGFIRDVSEFQGGIDKQEGARIVVVKH